MQDGEAHRLVRPRIMPCALMVGRTRLDFALRDILPLTGSNAVVPPTLCEAPSGKVTTFPKEFARLAQRRSWGMHKQFYPLPQKWGLGLAGVLERLWDAR